MLSFASLEGFPRLARGICLSLADQPSLTADVWPPLLRPNNLHGLQNQVSHQRCWFCTLAVVPAVQSLLAAG